jgi:hypothetical protein
VIRFPLRNVLLLAALTAAIPLHAQSLRWKAQAACARFRVW